MKMANAVQLLAEITPGKEAQAIEAFARALRQVCEFSTPEYKHLQFSTQVPTILADNGGYDSAALVAELRAHHAKGPCNMGLDMETGKVCFSIMPLNGI